MQPNCELFDQFGDFISRCVSIAKGIYEGYLDPQEELRSISEIQQLIVIITYDAIQLVDPELADNMNDIFHETGELVPELIDSSAVFMLTIIQKRARYELLNEGFEFDGSQSDAFDKFVLKWRIKAGVVR